MSTKKRNFVKHTIPMEIKKNSIHRFFLLLTLPLVLWLFFNQAAFWHYHILDNGIVVQHAHPFKNSPKAGTPFQSHQHSDFEYSVLAQISQVAALLLVLVLLGFLWQIFKGTLNKIYRSIWVATPAYSHALLRAPPVNN